MVSFPEISQKPNNFINILQKELRTFIIYTFGNKIKYFLFIDPKSNSSYILSIKIP